MENQTRSASGATRKRGRPAGKNRVPLSIEEKRARNAQYERERRVQYADAMVALAAASGFECENTNHGLIASVVNFIERASHISPSEDIQTLRRCNEKLLLQIQTLEQRLTSDELAALNASLTETEDTDEKTKVRTHNNKRGRKKVKVEKNEIKQETELNCTVGWPNREISSPEDTTPDSQWLQQDMSAAPQETPVPEAVNDSDVIEQYLKNWSIEDFMDIYL